MDFTACFSSCIVCLFLTLLSPVVLRHCHCLSVYHRFQSHVLAVVSCCTWVDSVGLSTSLCLIYYNAFTRSRCSLRAFTCTRVAGT
ncbi:hypothetical protein EV401DRAFT_1939743 [Pisolithus croceorrhizus]|nr:hypothetical protein EV401DRAFT_1939743 [Pisolithus croceorrhizus]